MWHARYLVKLRNLGPLKICTSVVFLVLSIACVKLLIINLYFWLVIITIVHFSKVTFINYLLPE